MSDKLNVVNARKPISINLETPKKSDVINDGVITVIIGMNNQIEIEVTSIGLPLSSILRKATRALNLRLRKYMSETRFTQNVFVDSRIVGAEELDRVISPGATVTVDEKKHNG